MFEWNIHLIVDVGKVDFDGAAAEAVAWAEGDAETDVPFLAAAKTFLDNLTKALGNHNSQWK